MSEPGEGSQPKKIEKASTQIIEKLHTKAKSLAETNKDKKSSWNPDYSARSKFKISNGRIDVTWIDFTQADPKSTSSKSNEKSNIWIAEVTKDENGKDFICATIIEINSGTELKAEAGIKIYEGGDINTSFPGRVNTQAAIEKSSLLKQTYDEKKRKIGVDPQHSSPLGEDLAEETLRRLNHINPLTDLVS